MANYHIKPRFNLVINIQQKPERHYLVMFWSIGKILLTMIRNLFQDS